MTTLLIAVMRDDQPLHVAGYDYFMGMAQRETPNELTIRFRRAMFEEWKRRLAGDLAAELASAEDPETLVGEIDNFWHMVVEDGENVVNRRSFVPIFESWLSKRMKKRPVT